MAREAVERTAAEWEVVGRFLTRVRESQGFTQEEVVARGGKGLSKAPLSMLENGRPQNNRPLRSTLVALGRAYGLPDEWWDHVISGDLKAASEAPSPDELGRRVTELESRWDRAEALLTRIEDFLDRAERDG